MLQSLTFVKSETFILFLIRSELTIEIDKNAMTSPFNSPTSHEDFHTTRRAESTSHSIRTNIVNLKTGYALSNIDEVRNLVS